MQTYSVNLELNIRFEYDPSSKNHLDAIRDAIDLALNPNFHSVLNGVKISRVDVSDPEGAGTLAEYGED